MHGSNLMLGIVGMVSLADVHENDEELARADILLRTPAELLQRFGTPTQVSRHQNGSMLWEYRDPPNAGPANQRFSASLTISDGYAIHLYLNCRRPRSD